VAWEHLTKDQKEMARRVVAGEYELISDVGWGFADEFFTFLDQVGFLDTLGEVDGEGFKRRMIPVGLLLMTYHLKVLAGLDSMNQVTGYLLSHPELLYRVGFTAREVKAGFCRRGKGNRQGPLHKDTLADFMGRLTELESMQVFQGAVSTLAKAGFYRSKRVWVLDATDLESTDRCRGAGRRTKQKRNGETETKHGFKLIMLWDEAGRLPCSAKMVKIQQSERRSIPELVEQAELNLGGRLGGVLLIDRGFLAGEDLWWLKHDRGLDFVIPARTDLSVTEDARGLRGVLAEEVVPGHGEDVDCYGVKGLQSYDGYRDPGQPNPRHSKLALGEALNAVVVTRWKDTLYGPGEEPVFLTSLPVDRPLEILNTYDWRSLIENAGFRELKQGWHLEKFPQKNRQAASAHVMLTLCMYAMTGAYRTKLGQKLTGIGIRRYRRDQWQWSNKLLVAGGGHYAIFDLEELLILLGKPPRIFFRVDPEEFKRRYGLP
jgi:hypothetical protein